MLNLVVRKEIVTLKMLNGRLCTKYYLLGYEIRCAPINLVVTI
jgi:hypothetical protein